MYLESIKENTGQQRPAFQEFIDTLKVQNEDLEKNAETLFHYANKFMDIREPPSEVEPQSQKNQEPKTILEILGLEIRRMQSYNRRLTQTCEAFQRIIGI